MNVRDDFETRLSPEMRPLLDDEEWCGRFLIVAQTISEMGLPLPRPLTREAWESMVAVHEAARRRRS